jgi:hypothetical protein
MNYIKFVGILMIVSIVFINCSEDTPLEPPPPSNDLSAFSEIQKQVFDVSCVSCHSGSTPQGGLDLSAANSYTQLVEVTSNLVPSQKRVDRNNSSESVLVRILRGDVSPRMPVGGAPLSSATIDSIAKWIDEGALNN